MTAPRTGIGDEQGVGDALVIMGAITESQHEKVLERVERMGCSYAEAAVSGGFIVPSEIGPHLEKISGFPFVDIADTEIDREASLLVPEPFALARRVLPYAFRDGRVLVAMADPLDFPTADELRSIVGRPIVPHLALGEDLANAIRRAFDVRHRTQALLEDMEKSAEQEVIKAAEVVEVEAAPIAKLVSSMVLGAVAAGASDVHVEPREHDVQVRYRVDGLLYDQMVFPYTSLNATMSRLKIISGLDIAERRRPQDGRFTTKDDSGKEYDVRLSIMPTVYGEKACMRLLLRTGNVASLDTLGFLDAQRKAFDDFVAKPYGLILVTGPTGSGKSTTLYAALSSINDPTININTVEDPVEYRLPGINQVQVNPKIGLTFATGLRTLVRQDPDVILVGEIRDRETAEISVQAALTGHLVLSSLHTNDAPGALIRLQNMGVEPFLIASSVVGIIGQRLLRKVCPHCIEEMPLLPELAQAMGLPMPEGKPPTVARGMGCKRCDGRGTRGRQAAYEVMTMTDGLRELILSGTSGSELHAKAVAEGMQTMRMAALQKVLDHTVPPEEVMRVFAHAE